MLALALTIATLQSPGAGTLPNEPAAIEQRFEADGPRYQMRASRDPMIESDPPAARARGYLEPNAGARAGSDYDQEPENIDRGTEP